MDSINLPLKQLITGCAGVLPKLKQHATMVLLLLFTEGCIGDPGISTGFRIGPLNSQEVAIVHQTLPQVTAPYIIKYRSFAFWPGAIPKRRFSKCKDAHRYKTDQEYGIVVATYECDEVVYSYVYSDQLVGNFRRNREETCSRLHDLYDAVIRKLNDNHINPSIHWWTEYARFRPREVVGCDDAF